MKHLYDFLTDKLKKQNIRLSSRRLKVLEYLCQNSNHPTVDQIYVSIQQKVPNLSRTTIYNTLHILIKAGLVRVIAIEDHETRYEIVTKDHGHFKCEKCGTIFDFKLDLATLVTEELINFQITDKNVYFKGICPNCLATAEDHP